MLRVREMTCRLRWLFLPCEGVIFRQPSFRGVVALCELLLGNTALVSLLFQLSYLLVLLSESLLGSRELNLDLSLGLLIACSNSKLLVSLLKNAEEVLVLGLKRGDQELVGLPLRFQLAQTLLVEGVLWTRLEHVSQDLSQSLALINVCLNLDLILLMFRVFEALPNLFELLFLP